MISAHSTRSFLVGAIGVYFLVVMMLFAKAQEEDTLVRSQKLERLESEYLVALNGYRLLADFVFDHLINTAQVRDIMAAAHDHPQARPALRARLLSDLTPLYSQLAGLHFRQVHFHLADSRSFLRFHRPEKFGDSLVGVRETVVAANVGGNRVRAFEEGRIFNGFRFVYPLFEDSRHVGSVEISISSAALIAELSRLFGKHYHFLLDKKVVGEKVFADEQENYSPSLLAPQLVHDREVLAITRAATVMVSEERAQQLTRRVARRHASEIAGWQPLVFLDRQAGMSYTASLLPIANFSGEKVAYLMAFEGDRTSGGLLGRLMPLVVLLTLLFAAIVAFFLHLARTGRRLEAMSATDFLTGIHNRGKGYELLVQEHQRVVRYGGGYCLLMFDIDHFKAVNDGHGHPVGDAVLRQVVQIVGKTVRGTDGFCRWGGEEFLVLLPETTLDNALLLADKIRCLVADYDFDHVGRVTISLGVTESGSAIVPVDDVLQRLDKALYQAKKTGRNRVCHLSPPSHEAALASHPF